jgi:hypothetical protein
MGVQLPVWMFEFVFDAFFFMILGVDIARLCTDELGSEIQKEVIPAVDLDRDSCTICRNQLHVAENTMCQCYKTFLSVNYGFS